MSGKRPPPVEEFKVSNTIKIVVWSPISANQEPTFSLNKSFYDKKLNTWRSSQVLYLSEMRDVLICIAKVLSRYSIVELEAGMAEIERVYRAGREEVNAVSLLHRNAVSKKYNLGNV